ncbi:Eco57I restriction-modification methylase domain-containing protein [Flagellimonas zhangzhouensis]|uniref:site-specific DNA-methyltransferase (adenine-specific) n=1 Tax=Flagellimonas zhangzhouensis TaxID=1073328 RepID=A0A1H2WLN6_9FLAO|nr:N-6 DNA Methylase [Allomuricauda zhangzhouensis]SDW81481.1 N-6 DNA Methylase [Allomuricauda zhangzhouensis]
MPLFQTSVLKNYLSQQDEVAIEKAYLKYSKYFLNQEIQQNIRNSKEEQFQATFLTELFVNVLDYSINPSPKYNLTTEFKNEKGAKKADGAILKEGKALGVVELKGTGTKDLDKVNSQAFSYKNNHSACVYVITSNFEKLRFFVQNAVEHIEFNLFTLTQEEFKLLWLCMHVENLLSGIPLKIKEESLLAEEDITKQLYKDYSAFKTALWQNMVKNHPDYDQLILFKKTQKLLDRFLFIFFAEDSGLLPPNSVKKIIDKWKDDTDWGDERKLYDIFKQYFGFINSGRPAKDERAEIFGYNGGLFIEDSILDNIKIDDDILLKYSEKLSTYDFQSEVDVNILGHIFENSLNEIENITAELEGQQIDKNKTKRKKDGVFYTPKYITKYIVDNTIGKLCEEKKAELSISDERFGLASKRSRKGIADLQAYRDWLLDLKICDPACGSGAFLNQALEFLIDEHKYLDELTAQYHRSPLVLSDIETQILEQNIYGVDINEESVEIAKLSLWLRTAQRGRKLTSLNNNIKCGNSLIDDRVVAGEKAFNWKKEFPKVFEKGGFDAVIGNPPYVDIKGLDKNIVTYLFEKFQSANNRVNLYSSFIERSLNLLNKHKYFSFIIPSSLLTQESYKELRKILLEYTTITNIVRLPNESFGGSAGEVKVDTIILSFKLKVEPRTSAEIYIYKGFDRINEITTHNADIHFFTNPFDWKKDDSYIFRINVDNKTMEIVEKCEFKTEKLVDCAHFCLGLTPYDKYKGHTQDQIKNRVFHATYQKDETFKKLLAGNDITRYHVEWGGAEWISYGDWLGAPREPKFFTKKRILVKQIIDWSDKRIWAAIIEEELYNTQNAFNLIAKEGYIPEYLIALINSRLISFYHRKKYLEEFKDRFQKILIKDAKEFPIKQIPEVDQKPFISAVNNIVSATSQLQKAVETFAGLIQSKFGLEKISTKLQNWYKLEFKDFLKELKKAKVQLSLSEESEWMQYFNEQKHNVRELKSETNRIDSEIDQMVYQLYGLTEEEIKVVESN